MRAVLATVGASVVVGEGLILVDPDLPADHALLLVCAMTDCRPDVARGWLTAAYAQDPRRAGQPVPP